jgi:hypothetical protein
VTRTLYALVLVWSFSFLNEQPSKGHFWRLHFLAAVEARGLALLRKGLPAGPERPWRPRTQRHGARR